MLKNNKNVVNQKKNSLKNIKITKNDYKRCDTLQSA